MAWLSDGEAVTEQGARVLGGGFGGGGWPLMPPGLRPGPCLALVPGPPAWYLNERLAAVVAVLCDFSTDGDALPARRRRAGPRLP